MGMIQTELAISTDSTLPTADPPYILPKGPLSLRSSGMKKNPTPVFFRFQVCWHLLILPNPSTGMAFGFGKYSGIPIFFPDPLYPYRDH